MKALTSTGLPELITKVKAWCRATFLNKTDVEQATTLAIDVAPTVNSNNLVTSGGVYTAIDAKIGSTEKGTANGVATLDSNGKIPTSQLDIENSAVSGSTKPITSGAVYSILGTVEAALAAI